MITNIFLNSYCLNIKKLCRRWKKKIDIFLLFPLQFYYCAYLCSVVHIFTSKFSSLTLLSFLFEIHIRQFGSWKNKCVPQARFFFVSFDYVRWKNNIFSPTFFRKLYDKIFHPDIFLGFSESHTRYFGFSKYYVIIGKGGYR